MIVNVFPNRYSVTESWQWLMLQMERRLLLHLMVLLYWLQGICFSSCHLIDCSCCICFFKVNMCFLLAGVDIMLNFIFHFCVYKGKLMTSKFSTAVLSVFFYCPRFSLSCTHIFVYLFLFSLYFFVCFFVVVCMK